MYLIGQGKKEDYLKYAFITIFTDVGANTLNFLNVFKYLQVKKNFCYFAQFLKDKICKYTFHNIRVLMNQ